MGEPGHGANKPPSSTVEFAAAGRPYIKTCIADFDLECAILESNLPVDKGSSI